MNDIEIKKIDVKELVVPTKRTLYLCVYWNSNGTMFTNGPSEDKKYQENYAISMSKHSEHTCIYSFEIDLPNFKKQNT
jgi:hypothetical protein